MIPAEALEFLLVILLCAYGHYSSKVIENNPNSVKDVNKMTEGIIKTVLIALLVYGTARLIFKF